MAFFLSYGPLPVVSLEFQRHRGERGNLVGLYQVLQQRAEWLAKSGNGFSVRHLAPFNIPRKRTYQELASVALTLSPHKTSRAYLLDRKERGDVVIAKNATRGDGDTAVHSPVGGGRAGLGCSDPLYAKSSEGIQNRDWNDLSETNMPSLWDGIRPGDPCGRV